MKTEDRRSFSPFGAFPVSAALILLLSLRICGVDTYSVRRTNESREISKSERDEEKRSVSDFEALFGRDDLNKLSRDKEKSPPNDRSIPGKDFKDFKDFKDPKEPKEKILRASSAQAQIRFPLSDDKNKSATAIREIPQLDESFVFPDEIEKFRDASIRPAPVCYGSTFCEDTQHYPRHLVNMAIEKNDSLKLLASEDIVSKIVQRIDFATEIPLCLSTEQVVYPKSAESIDNEWLYVVNQENLKQGVRIETCSRENSECNLIDNVAIGYKMVCKQRYIYRQLVAVSNSGTVLPQLFRFPSSCCCQAHFEGYPRTRMSRNPS